MRSATSLVVITILLQSSSELLRLIERSEYITYLFQGNVRAAEKQSSLTYSLILPAEAAKPTRVLHCES